MMVEVVYQVLVLGKEVLRGRPVVVGAEHRCDAGLGKSALKLPRGVVMRHDIRIHLIEGGPRILPVLKERISAATTELLHKLDVDVITSERVTEVTANAVNTASGKSIPADLTVWAAGIRAPSVLGELGLPVNKLGQVVVSRTLQVEGEDSIYAFGDCASCPWPEASTSVPPQNWLPEESVR